MKMLLILMMAVVPVLLLACGGGDTDKAVAPGFDQAIVSREVPVMVMKEVIVEKAVVAAAESLAGAPADLEIAGRKVISTASVTVEVEEVQQAVGEVRLIAEGLGGFVEHLSSFGRPEQQRATITIRVPQDQFSTALERIEALGEVQAQTEGSEDVSERFIDLEARLKSALREEESLLSLLERANAVSEILTIERELSRVRSEIERFQGQLNFLERRVDLATISVNLVPPEEEADEPPSAALTVEVSDVAGSVDELKALVSRSAGELDSVFLSVRDGKDRADISFRVFTPEFGGALDAIEREGKLVRKELQEGKTPAAGDAKPPKDPDARINVSFEEAEGTNAGLIIAIVAPIGGVALAGLLGLLFYLTYRTGRRRAQAG